MISVDRSHLHTPTLEHIHDAIARWFSPDRVQLRSKYHSVNTVVEIWDGRSAFFLRLGPASWRNRGDVDAELSFVKHLARSGCAVALPVSSSRSALVEEVGNHYAVMFEEASGRLVEPNGPAWHEKMFRAWGAALADQHIASIGFHVPETTWRCDWRREPVLVQGVEELGRTNLTLYAAAERVLEDVERHSEALGLIGMVHADFAPENFRWSKPGKVTAFDFDNCCRHWLMYDLVVARSILSRYENGDRFIGWVLAGYEARTALPGDFGLADLLGRMRLLYVLCDRLCAAEIVGAGVSTKETARATTRFLQTVGDGD